MIIVRTCMNCGEDIFMSNSRRWHHTKGGLFCATPIGYFAAPLTPAWPADIPMDSKYWSKVAGSPEMQLDEMEDA